MARVHGLRMAGCNGFSFSSESADAIDHDERLRRLRSGSDDLHQIGVNVGEVGF